MSDHPAGAGTLQAIDLSYSYAAGMLALHDVNFSARAGQFVALLGPNGSGKTTLLRHFTGMLRPTRGQVLVAGRALAGNNPTWVHLQVGFLCQDPNDQLFGATVGEDVAFGPRNLGLDREETGRRVRASLETVGLRGFGERPIPALSFGEKRRVALAGVLAMEPAILVLDEPTAGLDPLRASQLLSLLHRLSRQEGKTVVMATHDVDIVPAYADQVYVMREGAIVAAGTPPVVFAQPQLIRESHMRLPRVAHALQIAGHELGLPLVELPLTAESAASVVGWGAEEAAGHGPVGTTTERHRLTTGAAAAAAARAAAELLLQGVAPARVELRSPLGAVLVVPVATSCLAGTEESRAATAEVVRAGGGPDDPLDGVRIRVEARYLAGQGIHIEGGAGIGRVARAGLPVPVGEAAINPLPRQMIGDAVGDLVPAGRGLLITVSAPDGVALAAGTTNAAAGIVGGIAILGGLPRPEPASEMAEGGRAAVNSTYRSPTGVLLLGHGSRAAEANEAMYRVLAALRAQGDCAIVEAGFMELNPPTVFEGAAACIAQGARTVLMVPYFLHTGMHLRQDLPQLLTALQERHPQVQFVLGPPLGFHPKLVEVVRTRIEECRTAAQLAHPARAEDDEEAAARPAGPLRTGYTTGACAAAAARAAAQALLSGEPVTQVEIALPAGQVATFAVQRCEVSGDWARCAVVKDGGDDPDATHGAEIEATVAWGGEAGLTLVGGRGVGVVTKRGLELPVGEPAINPVPRQMIRHAVGEALGGALQERGARVVIAVPRGEEIARRTLNGRLGILGGISILGTTGIVVPFSTEAYTATIAQALDIAVAAGCQEVVLTTGRRSERFAQAVLALPEEAFIQMGDFVGFALPECARRGIARVTICAMVGKLAKIAAGHRQTHVGHSHLEPSFLAQVAAECGLAAPLVAEIGAANTGRHFAEIVLEKGATAVFTRLCALAAEQCYVHGGRKLAVTCIMTDFTGNVLGRATVEG